MLLRGNTDWDRSGNSKPPLEGDTSPAKFGQKRDEYNAKQVQRKIYISGDFKGGTVITLAIKERAKQYNFTEIKAINKD